MFETKGYQVIDLNFGFEISLIVQTFEECVKINNIVGSEISIKATSKSNETNFHSGPGTHYCIKNGLNNVQGHAVTSIQSCEMRRRVRCGDDTP